MPEHLRGVKVIPVAGRDESYFALPPPGISSPREEREQGPSEERGSKERGVRSKEGGAPGGKPKGASCRRGPHHSREGAKKELAARHKGIPPFSPRLPGFFGGLVGGGAWVGLM